jgi:AcrR family transcriptional regulator
MNETVVRHTKDRILDAAELLVAGQGVFGTSLRQITSEAGVNLAAVNYHFQSKDDLMLAIYRRRVQPVNEERLAMLDELESTYGNSPVPLEEVLRAFIEPVLNLSLKMAKAGIPIGGMLGRLYTEPFSESMRGLMGEMATVAKRFSKAFRKTVPLLSEQEVSWRLWFTIGIIAHTLGAADKLKWMSGGACDPENRAQVLRQMVAYAKAGWEAPKAK